MMINFINVLTRLSEENVSVKIMADYLVERGYENEIFMNMMSLPWFQRNYMEKISLIQSLFDDGIVNIGLIKELCNAMVSADADKWHDVYEAVSRIVEKSDLFSRDMKMLLAHYLEIMYAKGMSDCGNLAERLYGKIGVEGYVYDEYREDVVRVKLARIAYSCNAFNGREMLGKLCEIKRRLKRSGNTQCLGMVHYYKAVCMQRGEVKPCDYKDAAYHMRKSSQKGFALAEVFIRYNRLEKPFETSRIY